MSSVLRNPIRWVVRRAAPFIRIRLFDSNTGVRPQKIDCIHSVHFAILRNSLAAGLAYLYGSLPIHAGSKYRGGLCF